MIFLSLGRWSTRHGCFLTRTRLYWRGWRWTPFCRFEKRYKTWLGFWGRN